MKHDIARFYFADEPEEFYAGYIGHVEDMENDDPPAVRVEGAPTLDELTRLCDDDAENANYHGMVGAAGELAGILLKHVGEGKARDVMQAVAEAGGLHEMGRG